MNKENFVFWKFAIVNRVMRYDFKLVKSLLPIMKII
jgi:hypothetical protein